MTLNQIRPDGRMLPGEPESVAVQATYVAGRGWSCSIAVRRQFQEWSEASRGFYEMLSTPELVTPLIDAELATELRV
jgi:hypothetical protein